MSPPTAEAEVLGSLAGGGGGDADRAEAASRLLQGGAIILVGERLAESPGALSAAARLAEVTGAKLAWIPRRAGERGAIEAGALPHLLPGGRPVADAGARSEVGRRWSVSHMPPQPGRDTAAILAAAEAGELSALVIAGVDLDDLPDPEQARAALARVPLVVSLELRASNVTDRADVVFPVAAAAEKSGTYLDWEGRPRPFEAALDRPDLLTDLRVLAGIADRMDVHLGLPDGDAALRELDLLGDWGGPRPSAPAAAPAEPGPPPAGRAQLATWAELLDAGRMQDGEPFLAGTARRPVARISPATAAELGVGEDDPLHVSTEAGSLTLPVVLTEMPDRTVWLPTNADGCAVRRDLSASTGSLVTLSGSPA